MSNPFEDVTETAELEGTETVNTTDASHAGEVETDEVDLDVDTPELAEADDETEELPEGATAEKPAKEKKAKEKKEPARPAAPEGYESPVAFAKRLTKHLEAKGAKNTKGLICETNPIAPQQMYSTINSTKGGKNPFPVHSVGGRENMIKPAEGLAWWDAKDERVAESKAAVAAKAQKKAEKAAAKEAEVTEAEGDSTETVEVTEAE